MRVASTIRSATYSKDGSGGFDTGLKYASTVPVPTVPEVAFHWGGNNIVNVALVDGVLKRFHTLMEVVGEVTRFRLPRTATET